MEYSPRLTARRHTPRAGRDPTRIVLYCLQPLLIANVVAWKWQGFGWMAGAWFVALVASLLFLRRT